MITQEGYYKILHQDWWEDADSKTGWTGSGWNEGDGFELVDYLELDKFGNPIKALFTYNDVLFFGIQNAAYNIQARFVSQFIELVRKYDGKTLEEIKKLEPNLNELSIVIDSLEKEFEIKKYLGIKK